ncbi:MAG: hypothetical protein RLY20_3033 [Verrucomicrobiota bacterium]|jgi:hypothetical protein
MKRLLAFVGFLALCVGSTSASLITNVYTGSFANGGVIPDNNLSGWSDTHTLSGYTGSSALVENVTVTLNITGGWNGDLYGYLVHVDANSSIASVVLLNRVGTGTYPTYGYGEAGFNNVTLIDSTSLTSIQNYGGSGGAAAALASGNYNSAGNTGSAGLDQSFDGMTVDGSWSLFLADMSSGDISQVTGWTLTVEAVPEPTTWAMLAFGAILGGWHFSRREKTV